MIGHPKFRFGLNVFLILLGVCLWVSYASAEGGLRMIVSTHEGQQEITLSEENQLVSGQIKKGLKGVTPVQLKYGNNLLTLNIGKHSYPIDRIESGQLISYGGVVEKDRGISAQAGKSLYGLIITGTIENEVGRLIDFTVVSDAISGDLNITWRNSLLWLRKEADKPDGNCSGMIRQETPRIGNIECQSSGTLKDAFFKNPDQILAWLVIPFVK